MKKRMTGMAGDRRPRETTLLALVQALTREGYPENEVEKKVHEFLECGRFILIGNFRGVALRPSHPGRSLRPTGWGVGRRATRVEVCRGESKRIGFKPVVDCLRSRRIKNRMR